MRLLSDAAEYALRAVVWLAGHPGQPLTTQEIARDTRATPGYLARVLKDLGRAGIIKGRRGTGGGFVLTRDPADITALDVVNAVDPIERITTCPLGLKSHGERLCALHRRIDDAMAHVEAAFAGATIADVLAEPSRSTPLCEGAGRNGNR
jgi:Rrf2 family protein